MALPCRLRADAEAQDGSAVEDGACEQRLTGRVGGVDQLVGRCVTGDVVDAHQVERRRRRELEAIIGADLLDEPGRSGDVFADHRLHRLDTVEAEVEPELQGAEATAERDAPVAIVDHCSSGEGSGAPSRR